MRQLNKWALAVAVGTMALVTSSAVGEAFEGDYPCCGDLSCDTLYAKKACPGGLSDCPQYTTTCCGDVQTEPRCFMETE